MKNDDPFPVDPDNLPSALSEKVAAKLLGMEPPWLGILAKNGHARCLGGYQEGCRRHYGAKYILPLMADLTWLDEGFFIIHKEIKEKNAAAKHKKEGNHEDIP